MSSYFGMIWTRQDPDAAQAAHDIRIRIERRQADTSCLAQSPGFELHDLDSASGALASLALTRPDGTCAGALFGTVFLRRDTEEQVAPLTSLSADETALIEQSAGQYLIDHCWGSYVAFLQLGASAAVIVDPTASIPCYYYGTGNLILVFSKLEACDFLDRSKLTLNYRFVSALLAYDKILNGETGLREVRELLGGQRLIFRDGVCEVSDLWDPRASARNILEEKPRDLAGRLRHTVRHVVRSRASAFEEVQVSLSGGLDSAVVLSCLAAPSAGTRLGAVHFRLASEDTPETDYARDASACAGVPLLEITADPLAGFPDIENYPLTVRPSRTRLAPDPQSFLPDVEDGRNSALFTGQGGDHLFRTARSPLGFADFLANRGPAGEAPSILMETARLSGESIWGVLGTALPALAGRRRPSAMEKGIASRRTLVNRMAHETIDIAGMLPRWAREPCGLPPGKFDQVSTLMHMVEVRDTLMRPGQRQTVHPLISQPLIELCLQIPTYRLSAGGVSRGLVRSAFAGDLPASIRLRTTKGRASRFYMDRIRSLLGRCRAVLADGELVRNNLVSREDLAAFMTDEHLLKEGSATMLLVYYGIECWLRSWKQVQAPGPHP